MSARKLAILHHGTEASRIAALRGSEAGTRVGGDQDVAQVIGDIRHELGNYFHKLYYLADLVSEEANPTDEAAIRTGALLGPTLRAFEEFLRSAFAHFSPPQLELVPVSVREIATAANQFVGGTGHRRRVRVVSHVRNPDRMLRVDPGLLSSVVQVIAERADDRAPDGATVEVSVDGDPSDVVLLTVVVEPSRALPPPAHRLEVALRWAKARQVVAVHGGTLQEVEEASAYRMRLSLPG